MHKKVSGIICLLHPVLITLLLTIYQLEFFWYWSDNYPLYDLIYASLSLVLFFIGLALVFKKHRMTMGIFVLCTFTVYQIFSFRADTPRFDALIKLPEQRSVALINNSGGAFTTSGHTNLLLFKPAYWLFCREVVVKSYPDVGFGKLYLSDAGQLEIELTTYKKEKISDNLAVDTLVLM